MFSFLSKFSMCTQLRFCVRVATRLVGMGVVVERRKLPPQLLQMGVGAYYVDTAPTLFGKKL